jgi:GNAT superfamily N-acetyltransferase
LSNVNAAEQMDLPVEAFRRNVCSTYRQLGSRTPGALFQERDDMWLCTSGFAHPIGNFACCFSSPECSEIAAIAEGQAGFRAYVVTGDTPGNLGTQLEANGMTFRYRLTGLACIEPLEEGDSRLQHQDSREAIVATASFMVDTFFWKSQKKLRDTLIKILAGAAEDGQEFYAWHDAQGLAAAATLAYSPGVAGIYNLCVRTDLRGQGIGGAAVAQLARLARNREATAFLQSEEALSSWYESLRFVPVTELTAYSY